MCWSAWWWRTKDDDIIVYCLRSCVCLGDDYDGVVLQSNLWVDKHTMPKWQAIHISNTAINNVCIVVRLTRLIAFRSRAAIQHTKRTQFIIGTLVEYYAISYNIWYMFLFGPAQYNIIEAFIFYVYTCARLTKYYYMHWL